MWSTTKQRATNEFQERENKKSFQKIKNNSRKHEKIRQIIVNKITANARNWMNIMCECFGVYWTNHKQFQFIRNGTITTIKLIILEFCFACTVWTVDSTINYANILFSFKLISCTNNNKKINQVQKINGRRKKLPGVFLLIILEQQISVEHLISCIQSTLHQIQLEYNKNWLK